MEAETADVEGCVLEKFAFVFFLFGVEVGALLRVCELAAVLEEDGRAVGHFGELHGVGRILSPPDLFDVPVGLVQLLLGLGQVGALLEFVEFAFLVVWVYCVPLYVVPAHRRRIRLVALHVVPVFPTHPLKTRRPSLI